MAIVVQSKECQSYTGVQGYSDIGVPSGVWLSQCGPNTVLGMSELHRRSGYSDRWLFRDTWLSQCSIGNASVQSYMSVYGLFVVES